MPWSDDGPPKESNYDVAYQRMFSSEKTFKGKNYLEDVQVEIQKLLELEFIVEIEQVNPLTSLSGIFLCRLFLPPIEPPSFV